MTILEHALSFASAGYQVFPIEPKQEVPSYLDEDIPNFCTWSSMATTIPTTIEWWFKNKTNELNGASYKNKFGPTANYGILIGPDTVVLQVIGAEGINQLGELSASYGPLPPTLEIAINTRTFKWFRASSDHGFKPTIDRWEHHYIGVQDEGSFVMGPGSSISSGTFDLLSPIIKSQELPSLPSSWLPLLS